MTKPLLLTKPNPAPLLRHYSPNAEPLHFLKQIQAISQKACKGTTMGANVFNLRHNLYIKAFSLGISQLIYE